jgi:hypothetical protein
MEKVLTIMWIGKRQFYNVQKGDEMSVTDQVRKGKV